MSISRQRTFKFAASIGTLAILLGLMPILLIVASRSRFGSPNPLDDIPAPWRWEADNVRTAVTEPLRDDAVVNLIARTAISIAWLALLVIAVTTLFEVVHLIRHRGLSTPRVRGLSWAQSIARFIAIGLVAVLPAGGVTAAASSGGGLASSTIARALITDHGSATSAHPRQSHVQTATRTTGQIADVEHAELGRSAHDDSVMTHVVARGESVWEIAEQLSDGDDPATTMEIAEAILDANLGRTMSDGHRFTNPALIRQGWTLDIPAAGTPSAFPPAVDDGTTPSDDAVHPDAVVAPVSATSSSEVHIVVDGDTLSDIADEALGDRSAWPTIFDANEGREMSDGRTFNDPNLILPGWELEIPTIEQALDESPEPTGAAPFETTTDEDDPDPTTRTDTEDADLTATVDVEPADNVTVDDWIETPPTTDTTVTTSTSVPVTTSPTTTSTTTTTTTVPPTGEGDGGSVDLRPTESPQAPSPIRLEHAAMLAAGVLTLVGVRRARRLRAAAPRARVPVPPSDVASTERKLRTIEPGEAAARLDIALRAAAHQLAETGTQIGVVRLSHDGQIALRLTDAGRLTGPWIGIGQDWELPAAIPIELLADDARRAGPPCVALTQIGVDTLGRSVLVDLEAAGLTAVEARAEQADQVVTAIALGVASSLHSEIAHIVAASIDAECLLDHPNSHRRRSVAEAVDLAIALIGSTATNERSTFDLRSMRTGGEMWEPAVLLLDSTDERSDHLDCDSLPRPGHGIAVVCAAPSRRHVVPCIRIIAHADRWELDAFGELTEIAPTGLTTDDLSDVTALLDNAAQPVEQHGPADAESADIVDEPFEVIEHDIVVGLLGAVEVRSATGELGTFERSKTIELLAWLTTHRDRATRTAARTALWELDVRDATFANVVSEARRALGRLVPTIDGEEWLARTLNESLPLHDRVVTDADLVEQRLEHARLSAPGHAIDVLRPAVELIRDMPFAGTSYLWPDADGITSNLVLLATTVASELAAHALSIGDTETVFWATGHGLRVLPGHEELIALRMRARARAGDLAGVRQEWESYERVIVADAWSDGEPAPMLLELRRSLLSPQT